MGNIQKALALTLALILPFSLAWLVYFAYTGPLLYTLLSMFLFASSVMTNLEVYNAVTDARDYTKHSLVILYTGRTTPLYAYTIFYSFVAAVLTAMAVRSPTASLVASALIVATFFIYSYWGPDEALFSTVYPTAHGYGKAEAVVENPDGSNRGWIRLYYNTKIKEGAVVKAVMWSDDAFLVTGKGVRKKAKA